MAKDTKGGRRLGGNHSAASYTNPSTDDFSLDETISFSRTGSAQSSSSIDDAVIDEILRSISEQSDTPVPTTPRPSRSAGSNSPVSQHTATRTHSADNSYAAAARTHSQAARPASSSSTGNLPDPSYYAMRDPSQTQSFQPARPAHRDTDRLPTLVEEKPIRRKSVLGKVLTLLVTILVLVALVLGVKMLYILGPSMGLNLPDLSKLPVISSLVDLLPDNELPATDLNDITDDTHQEEADAPVPTAVSLDSAELTLSPGDSIVLTATLDVEGWDGTVTWGSSDKDEAIITVTSLGPTTAQVTYVGEGRCAVLAMVPVTPEDGSDPPTATCHITCTADESQSEEPEEPADTENTDIESTGEHIDFSLNREDFTLNVGERHQLMDDADVAAQVTWTSSNESVATVGETGIVTAVSSGTATITATGPDGTTAEAIARVK